MRFQYFLFKLIVPSFSLRRLSDNGQRWISGDWAIEVVSFDFEHLVMQPDSEGLCAFFNFRVIGLAITVSDSSGQVKQ